jgi:hypothetical protein
MSIRYQQYDTQTLLPVNDETRTRQNELEMFMHEVRNRSVLDIGCSNGFASVLSVQNGAKSVISFDVEEVALEKLDEVIEMHSLPIDTKRISFLDLSATFFQSEVVFCFEVIHWLYHQGLNTKTILNKLNEITLSEMFIETPWSTKDPSIVKYAGTSMDSYSLKEIVEGLRKLNFSVEILYFPSYFQAPNERVMLKAKRT